MNNIVDPTLIEQRLQMVQQAHEIKINSSSVLRHEDEDDNTIVIPAFMTTEKAAQALGKVAQEEERFVSVHHAIECFPLEGALALNRILTKLWGTLTTTDEQTWFGKVPPKMLSIPIGVGEVEQAPWGRIVLAMFEKDEYLETSMNFPKGGLPEFVIAGHVKRKNEALIVSIAAAVEDSVSKESIYKGKAMRLDTSWRNNGDDYDPTSHTPQFENLQGDMEELILPPDVKVAVEADLITRIMYPEAAAEAGMNPSIAALFRGRYGTGKSLTGRALATLAVEHGWTFFYLENASSVLDVVYAMRIAERFSKNGGRCLLMMEDIDGVTHGLRDTSLDSLLNTMDGILSKDKNLITIFTTNHANQVAQAMRRAGRISTYCVFTRPRGMLTVEFVKMYAGSRFIPDADYSELGSVLDNMSPAFIRAVVDRAVAYDIYDEGKVPDTISPDALLKSAKSMVQHAQYADGFEEDDEDGVVVVRGITQNPIEALLAQVMAGR